MSQKLTMRFTTEQDGKYFSLSVDNVKEDANGQPAITDTEVKTLMDLIIQKNIFATSYGKLVAKKDAKVVSTTAQEFSIV